MITSRVGSPVTGEDFFNRHAEQAALWEYLEGDDVLLLAPRRVGKTSLMLRLKDTAAESSFDATYLSVAGAENEIGFVRRLYEAVAKLSSGPGVLGRVSESAPGKLLKRVKKLEVAALGGIELSADNPWEDLGTAVARGLNRQEGRTLILIDEVPVLVLSLLRADPTGDRARRFLSWFRELRQQPDRLGALRWLLAGSIGLDTVASRLRLGDTINDLYLYRLGPFERPTAVALIREMATAYSFEIPEETTDHALDRIGWLIPYYIQLVFRELKEHCREQEATPDIGAVDRVFDALLSPAKKAYFDYWRQRLNDELNQPDAGFAQTLLNSVAANPEGETRSTLGQILSSHIMEPGQRDERLRFLLDVLAGDGYVVMQGNRYRFRSPLLREFWLRRVAP